MIRFVTTFSAGLMILLAGIALPSPAHAESGNYRVEVLIFNHLESNALGRELDEIRSFSEFMPLDEVQAEPAPLLLDVMSSVMQDTWRRLRLSATYRPLLFAAWEQSRIDYHPPVRLHDEELIAEQLHFPERVAYIDLQSPEMFEDYQARYFRLDGTVQLVRSRFLHLNLDLEYRQELRPPVTLPSRIEPANGINTEQVSQPAQPTLPVVVDLSDVPGSMANLPPNEEPVFEELLHKGPGPALVHTLRQSRQVRTAQMQYFDSPYLGVLIRVTATSGE